MKYYVVTALIIIQQMAVDYPQFGIVPVKTNMVYQSGDTLWVADGRFIDTCQKYSWGILQDITLDRPAVDRGILTYKSQINDTDISK